MTEQDETRPLDPAKFREWARGVQADLAMLMGRVVNLEEIDDLKADAGDLKARMADVVSERASLIESSANYRLTLAALEERIERAISNQLTGMEFKGRPTKDERRAQALAVLRKTGKFRGMEDEADSLRGKLVVFDAELKGVKDRDHQLGREVQLVIAEMNLLAAQIVAINSGG